MSSSRNNPMKKLLKEKYDLKQTARSRFYKHRFYRSQENLMSLESDLPAPKPKKSS